MKTNVTLKQQQKALAISLMKKLDIYQPYIDVFEKDNVVSYFEHYIGYWAYQDKELDAKVKEIEKEYGCRVYSITHEFTEFGECYSLLIVSKYKEESSRSLVTEDKTHYAFAYVWNKSDDWCSEFGDITVFTALAIFDELVTIISSAENSSSRV